MITPRRLSRKQLEVMAQGDQEILKALEKLFSQSMVDLPEDIDALAIAPGVASVAESLASLEAKVDALSASVTALTAVVAESVLPVTPAAAETDNTAAAFQWPAEPDDLAPSFPVGVSGEIDTSGTVIVTVHNGIVTRIV